MGRIGPVALPAMLVLASIACEAPRPALEYQWDETPVEVLRPTREIHAWPDGFRSVDAFAVDSAFNLYVGDTHFKQVVAVDSTGAVVWRSPIPVGAMLNSMGVGFGMVAVADRAGRTVLVIDAASGAQLRIHDWSASTTASFTNGQPLRILSKDGSLAFGLGDVLAEPDHKYSEVSGTLEYLVRFDGVSGEERRVALPQWTGILLSLPRRGGGYWGHRPKLVPRLVWTLNPDGGWTGGEGYEYEITVQSPDGAQEVWRRDVGPRRPSVAARKLELEIFEGMGETYASIRGRAEEFVADTIGHFTTMAYSVDGDRLWVGRTYFDPDPVYDVWDATGEFLCSVQLDMGGHVSMVRRTPPYIVNGRLYHLAMTSPYSSEAIVKSFDVSRVCRPEEGS